MDTIAIRYAEVRHYTRLLVLTPSEQSEFISTRRREITRIDPSVKQPTLDLKVAWGSEEDRALGHAHILMELAKIESRAIGRPVAEVIRKQESLLAEFSEATAEEE